jgi:HSP20 family molecular chaperone IbpA
LHTVINRNIFPPIIFPAYLGKKNGTCGITSGRKPTGTKKKEKEGRTMGTKNKKINKTLKIIEPKTTVIDEGKFLRILTELPGIEEQKIKIDLENYSTSVTIVAVNTVKQFKKVITIPCEVRFSKKRFSDEVLELTLEKNKC